MDDLMEGFAELYRVTWLVGLLVGPPTLVGFLFGKRFKSFTSSYCRESVVNNLPLQGFPMFFLHIDACPYRALMGLYMPFD